LDKIKDSLVIATRNRDKFREIQEKLRALPLAVLSLADFPFVEEVIEDQPDLYGNAIKKANQVAQQTGLWALADDTGLEVDALDGAPGVYSARYSGPGATYESNCVKLISEMEGIPAEKRQAQFRTVICLKTPDSLFCVEGKVEGNIGRERRGTKGFGYDPVFVLPSGRTMAEIDLEEKNRISHRGQAVEKMEKLLRFLLERD
jgi:XTP/dITP diphosphohydrolase